MSLIDNHKEYVSDVCKDDISVCDIDLFFENYKKADCLFFENCINKGAKYLLEKDSQNSSGNIKTQKLELKILEYVQNKIIKLKKKK
jgi:hypothetical protein